MPERISLEPKDSEDIDDGARVAVHPPTLQRWLRESATSDGPLRVHATARVQSPTPPLLAFDRLRSAGAGDDANGPYAPGRAAAPGIATSRVPRR